MSALLEAVGVTKRFGGLTAVDGASLRVERGEIVGLIGPNGCGKTTFFDCISRLHALDGGRISFEGHDITRHRAWQVARMGLARTFQVIRVYRTMSVRDNLLVSRRWGDTGLLGLMRRSPREIARDADLLLDLLLLTRLAHEPAGHLSGGQRRLLEIGMAMMPGPSLVLLDEAASGVNPTLVNAIVDRIKELNARRGTAFLLVEHDIDFVASLCGRVVVLNQGRNLAEGTPAQVRAKPAVIEAYFGD